MRAAAIESNKPGGATVVEGEGDEADIVRPIEELATAATCRRASLPG